MDIDTDLHRDAASAFGPASAVAGALLPYEGRTLLMSPDGLPAGALDASADGWLSSNLPILVRGRTKVLPLAWLGDPSLARGRGVTSEEIASFASKIQAAGMQWAGNWRVLPLDDARTDSIGSYTAALCDAGVTRVDCWTYSESVGLALVWAGIGDEGTMSLALHIIPASWVSEPRAEKRVSGIDVRWSWSDVVALHAVGSNDQATHGR